MKSKPVLAFLHCHKSPKNFILKLQITKCMKKCDERKGRVSV